VGDITCDVDGSLACTVRATEPDSPVYVYDPATGQAHDGVAGTGPVVLAVDFLPCELPVDASDYFSRSLSPFMPAVAAADFSAELADSGLPPELQRATIVYRGQLTKPYRHLAQYLK
jgi:alpha-aminoadipic semialdehyde synthase